MRETGYSLIEIVVVLGIAAVLLGLGVGSFQTALVSTRVRSAAESIQAGLNLARAEAIRRNAPMRFQLVSNLDATCAYSATSMSWVVSQTDQVARGLVAGACNALPYLPPDQPDPCNPDPGVCPAAPALPTPDCRPTSNPALCTSDPWIAFKSSSDAATGVTIAARTAFGSATAASVVTFGPLGQVLGNIGGVDRLGYVLVSPTTQADAKAWGVRINTVNGAIKFCDPALAAGEPLACI